MNRLYAKVKVPHAEMSHTLDVCVAGESRICNDGSVMLVKTTQDLIDSKVNSGVSMNTMFPPGLTTWITYEEASLLVEEADWASSGEEELE